MSNVSVETTVKHEDLSASTLIKGVNIQKNHVLMFDSIKKDAVDEHQPFQPQMISKLVSSNKPKTVIPIIRPLATEIMR